jgi:2-oxoglutarate ferredoxin oxidoreductase subunit alpha
MTATSGPGLSLMLENLGLGIMLEIPCVVVDVQRGSPSTGLPTMPGQSDVMQARWGSHGDYEIVAYSPWSVQEMFDLTVLAFNVADRYRTPVLLLCDEVVGHMIERLVIPPREDIEIWNRKKPKTSDNGRYYPFRSLGQDLVPPMMHAGEGYRVHFTGLTHDEHGYPDMSAETHHKLVSRLVNKIQHNADKLIRTESYQLDDAEIIVVAYGCTARSAQRAVREARAEGIPAGLLRLISLWPFPERLFNKLGENTHEIIAAEMNLGQISREIQRVIGREVRGIYHAGGEMIPPEPILEAILEAAR